MFPSSSSSVKVPIFTTDLSSSITSNVPCYILINGSLYTSQLTQSRVLFILIVLLVTSTTEKTNKFFLLVLEVDTLSGAFTIL
ncbi:MAG: hypothetical protein ACI4OP_06510 [Candidatus Coprovivens sp.]